MFDSPCMLAGTSANLGNHPLPPPRFRSPSCLMQHLFALWEYWALLCNLFLRLKVVDVVSKQLRKDWTYTQQAQTWQKYFFFFVRVKVVGSMTLLRWYTYHSATLFCLALWEDMVGCFKPTCHLTIDSIFVLKKRALIVTIKLIIWHFLSCQT